MPRELKNAPKEEDNSDVSPNVLRVVLAFRRWGWASFWTQVVLCVVSALVLLQLILLKSPTTNVPSGADSNPATLPGLSFAWAGIAVLGASIFWNFRYTQMANKLRSPDRPTKSQTVFQIKIGIIINLVGTLITLIGAASIVGALTLRSQQGVFAGAGNFNLTIQPLDFQIIQASFNIIFAHFVGLVTSLWLLNRATDKPNRE
ncbi:DUF3611 family protein [Pseudanabaena sp. FACHB-1998]|uniref:DUF3611 family protein n=1 Tax=Pseudanabaena sp. FACHB-1998 TaxID=2692858 RepID=UPI001680B25C|nr:DUF3611 family protein [Pseudanabaena sp. FACHB-1998]MBD2175565.1 DUF3611 family protein [Pseudanabaena sp. FACHB-1998]